MEYADHEELFVSCYFTDAVKAHQILSQSGYSITVEMFKKKEMKIIFQAISEMLAANLNVEFTTVREYCRCNIREIPYPVFVDLVDLSKPSILITDYASYILNSYKKELLLSLCLSTAESLKSNIAKPDQLKQQMDDAFEKVSSTINNRIVIKTQEMVYDEYEENELLLEELLKNNLGTTGLNFLDDNICFDKGYTFFIGGRSGTGKTTIAYQIVNDYARAFDTKALFISLEMPAKGLFKRSLGSYLGAVKNISLNKTEVRNMVKNNREIAAETIAKFKNILICDNASLSFPEIEQALNLARRQNKSVDIICIDYIGYIKALSGKTITEQVAIIARESKAFAKRLNVRLVMLSQTNRDGGEDGTKEISLNHFKDSGAIEESADIAIGIWQSKTETDRLHGKILKNREAEKDIKFDLKRYTTHFMEVPVLVEPELKPNLSNY